MDAPLHSLQTLESSVCGSTEESNDADLVDTISVDSIISHANPTVQFPPPTSASTTTASKLINRKKKKKRALVDVSAPSPSSSSSSYSMYVRVGNKRRNPRILMGLNRRSESEAEAIALPLGMSIAAIVSQILERKDEAGERMSVDHLSMICTMAVRESLANVFGDKFDCFVRNFEKSFGSTLRTLRLINESPLNKVGGHLSHFNMQNSGSDLNLPVPLNRGDTISSSSISDHHSSMDLHPVATLECLNTLEERQESIQTDSANRELTVHGQISQQLACVSSSSLGSVMNQSTQARSNDLKALELSLSMKKMKLKETQLALNSDSYLLERMKFSMEDTKHAELLRKCIDCLVAGLLIMSGSLVYGAYIYSYKRITEATETCTASHKEFKSWWIPKPMASLNSGFYILRCQVQVVSRMMFGIFMIVAIAYLLLQRSASSKQTMPVTFIILLLGVVCGVAGKFCVDTLGALCLLHFFSNICTSALFLLLHGPITVSQGAKGNTMIPYWIRRTLFYAAILLFLPLLCGLMPFASPAEIWNAEKSPCILHLLKVTVLPWESRNLAPTLCQAVCLMYSAEVGLAA
ncbi:hypothetical protein AAG906_023873 [Vitis piasezkii]